MSVEELVFEPSFAQQAGQPVVLALPDGDFSASIYRFRAGKAWGRPKLRLAIARTLFAGRTRLRA